MYDEHFSKERKHFFEGGVYFLIYFGTIIKNFMVNNDLSKKWNGLVKEYLDLEKSYKEKYKDDHIITSSVSTVTTFGC